MTAASWLRVIRAGVKKNWWMSVTYPTWLANRILSPIVWVAISIYSYTALVPEADVAAAFARAGSSPEFAGFLILGQTVFSFFSNLNFRGGMAIQRERWQGTLEIVLLAPTSRVAYLLGESVFAILDGGWTVLLALFVTSVAFHARFTVADPLLAVAAIVLTLAAMVALSLFFAAFYVLTRSAGPLSFAIQAPMRFLTGTSFPVRALPSALQALSLALPVTYGMVAIRAAFLGASPESMAVTLGALVAFTAGFLLLGVALVAKMEEVAKRRGTLHTF